MFEQLLVNVFSDNLSVVLTRSSPLYRVLEVLVTLKMNGSDRDRNESFLYIKGHFAQF